MVESGANSADALSQCCDAPVKAAFYGRAVCSHCRSEVA